MERQTPGKVQNFMKDPLKALAELKELVDYYTLEKPDYAEAHHEQMDMLSIHIAEMQEVCQFAQDLATEVIQERNKEAEEKKRQMATEEKVTKAKSSKPAKPKNAPAQEPSEDKAIDLDFLE